MRPTPEKRLREKTPSNLPRPEWIVGNTELSIPPFVMQVKRGLDNNRIELVDKPTFEKRRLRGCLVRDDRSTEASLCRLILISIIELAMARLALSNSALQPSTTVAHCTEGYLAVA
jgi:hypothetical protein